MEKLVSVVVATYRREETLRMALESLATQTYPWIEVVLVDDNAEESWQKKVSHIVQDFATQFPDIPLRHIVNTTNQGSANTRNIGIQAAVGEYVTFLDDDDLYLPEKITHQVQGMGEADYSLTDLLLYSESGRLVERRSRDYISASDPESLLRCHLMYHMTGTDTMMFRREYLLEIGGFPPIDVGDEFYLMKEAICGGGKFAYVPGCFVKAYIHTGGGGLSSGDGKIEGENHLYTYKKQFFYQIDGTAQRYIRMRHHAVLAFAELRRRNYGAFLTEGIHSFFCAPFACMSLLHERTVR